MNESVVNEPARTGSAAALEADKSSTKRPGFFSRDFTPEDLILYVFCLLLLSFLAAYFWNVQSQQFKSLTATPATTVKSVSVNWPPTTSDSENTTYLKAQVEANYKRYEQATKILLSNSTRKNTGFLVGTLLAFLGCMIVIRRVRHSPIEASWGASEKAQVKILTSSPGVFITFLGTIVILATVLDHDKLEVTDQPVTSLTGPEVISQAERMRPEDVDAGTNAIEAVQKQNQQTQQKQETQKNKGAQHER